MKASQTSPKAPKKQPQTAPKRKNKLHTSEAKQAQVIAKKLAGQSAREIARDMHMSHHTVGNILSRSQYQEIVRHYQNEMLGLIPPSLNIIRRIVTAKYKNVPDGNARKAATDLLKGGQVYVKKQEVELAPDPLDNMSREEIEHRMKDLEARKAELEAV